MKTSSALVLNVPLAGVCLELLVKTWLESTIATATVLTPSVTLFSLKKQKHKRFKSACYHVHFFLSYVSFSFITESGRNSSKFIIAIFTADTISEPINNTKKVFHNEFNTGIMLITMIKVISVLLDVTFIMNGNKNYPFINCLNP